MPLAQFSGNCLRESPYLLPNHHPYPGLIVEMIWIATVIDVQELAENVPAPATLLIFRYDVGGVSYEASQDVTHLRQLINLHSCRLGLPTSVRYDPQNPGNSIVVSEKWMGLRQ